MHKLLLTSALVIPFTLGTALAQDTAAPAEETPPATESAIAPDAPGTAPADPALPADPAASADPAAAPADQTDALQTEMASSDKIVHQQTANELRLDWITGASVMSMSPDGEKVGDITDLILDGSTGQMSAAIIGVGGFLGIGQKQIAVPWDRLNINYDAREVTTDLTRDEANAAPEYVFRQQDAPPAATQPVVAPDPTVTPGADPAVAPGTDPAVAPGTAPMDPAADPMTTTDPAVTDPALTDPAVTDPALTDPAPAETTPVDPTVEPVTPADGMTHPETEAVPAPSN